MVIYATWESRTEMADLDLPQTFPIPLMDELVVWKFFGNLPGFMESWDDKFHQHSILPSESLAKISFEEEIQNGLLTQKFYVFAM